MPRLFHHATAEQTVAVAEATQVLGEVTIDDIEKFCDLSTPQATNALNLAVDMGMLVKNGTKYKVANPLTKYLTTPNDSQKAAVLNLVLDSYEPYIIFRDRLSASGSADAAARQTKFKLELDAHREEIKDTLVSLGTYSGSLESLGGARYRRVADRVDTHLTATVAACTDLNAAEASIIRELGSGAESCSRQDVIIPLATALLKAVQGKPEEAVTEAGKGIESFLAELAGRMGVNLAGAAGIIQKLDKFRPNLPKKILESAKYLGQVRNAADHGVDVDPDVNAVWKIQQSTGLLYVFVACAFITACTEREAGVDFII